MSAIGITVLEDGIITDEFSSLVDPEISFDPFNTWLTGARRASWGAPSFPALWPRIELMLASGLPVAHNAEFDLGVLRRCLDGYGIEWKPYTRYLCTVQMGRKLLHEMSHKLDALAAYYGIPLNHHRAASDSHACAEILRRYMTDGADVRQFIRTY